MNVLVLGLGLQGKAVVQDLVKNDLVHEIVVADVDEAGVRDHLARKGYTKCRAVRLDASRASELLDRKSVV